MATCVVTGGAGFLRLASLRRRCSARGHRVICVDNLETGSLANIEHLRSPEFVFVHARRHRAVLRRRAGRLRLPLRVARRARSTTCGCRCRRSRSARTATHHALGLAKLHRARFLTASTSRGLRRPAGPPAAGVLLGSREPDRAARRLRRGQALRRSADDGLPQPAGRGHGDRADLQHLRPADASVRRPRDPDVHAPGAAGPADHRSSATGQQTRSFTFVDDLVDGHHPARGVRRTTLPVNIGNPNEFTLLELADAVDRDHRARARRSSSRRSRPTIRRCASPTFRSRASCLAGSRTVELREGLRRTLEASGIAALTGVRALSASRPGLKVSECWQRGRLEFEAHAAASRGLRKPS